MVQLPLVGYFQRYGRMKTKNLPTQEQSSSQSSPHHHPQIHSNKPADLPHSKKDKTSNIARQGSGGQASHHVGSELSQHSQKIAHVNHSGHEEIFRRRFWVCLVLSVPVLLYSPMLQEWLGFSMPSFPGSEWIIPVFSVVVFLYGGVPFLRMAVPELRNRKPGMMTLISLAISVAFFYSLAALMLPGENSFFWELVTLIDIMLLGHWLEMRSVRQASRALNELANLMPDIAELISDGDEIELVKVSELSTGNIVLVRPGASVPSDGEVVKGESDINESMITGESTPVRKEPGDKVIGGTINGNGSLRVKVTATGDNTALAGIMRLVEQAQLSKSNTQILADKAAGWLFYIALAVAALTAVAWTIAEGLNVDVVARVATVLVIACPHALGLAIPLVIAITTSLGAQNGILVRDRISLETMRQIDTIIFDKTGTLTKGEFGVIEVETMDGWDEEQALALAASVEGDSEHTIALGFRKTAEDRNLPLPVITDFEAIQGRGVRGKRGDRFFYVGGPRLFEMLQIDTPEKLAHFEKEASSRGESVVSLVEEVPEGAKAVASFSLADVIRPESKIAIDKLVEKGISVAMLTGDSQAVAKSVSDKLGIDIYFAEVLPEHKDQKVAELQEQGRRVAMVGDGVNDAPALTRADVGIAIGGGTDIAIESAGIILVRSNPVDVVKIFSLSQASYRKMIENLAWATGYNVIALPLAAGALAPFGILLSPAVGALLMSLSTVIVAINAQFLRRAGIGG